MDQNIIEDKVLIVDDNPHNRYLLKSLLEVEGIPSEEAESGSQALKMLEEGQYWIALIDLLMPGISGYETIRTIRQRNWKLPVIAVSAINFKQDQTAAFDAGCDCFLSKPIDTDRLFSIINEFRNKLIEEKANCSDSIVEAPDDQKCVSEGEQIKLEAPLSGMRVFIIEGEEEISSILKTAIQNSGCESKVFNSGVTAWDAILMASHKPDILICNLHLPEIDGLGLLVMTKRKFPEIPFILYTETVDEDVSHLAAREGADRVIAMELLFQDVTGVLQNEVNKPKDRNAQSMLNSTLKQIQKAQKQLISYGCKEPCQICDIAFASLCEAGGDMACCRKFDEEGRCGFVLMDVAGHDIVSSYLSAVCWGMLSSNWHQHQEPENLAVFLNSELFKLGYQTSHICLTAILWDPPKRRLSITYAGNPGGMMVKSTNDGTIEMNVLDGGGMVLGLFPNNKQMVHKKFRLLEESSLIFYSDGIEDSHLRMVLDEIGEPSMKVIKNTTSQQLLDALKSRYKQSDDMILAKLNFPALRS